MPFGAPAGEPHKQPALRAARRRKSPRHPSALPLILFLAVSHAGSSAAQSALPKVELPPELRTLVRIKQKVRQSLDELPNYTCLQRIDRTRLNAEAGRQAKKKRERNSRTGRESVYLPLDSTDTLEVEVALIDGKELYSWPGADAFEDRPLSEIVGFGTVGTGDFSSHVRALFVDSVARLDYVGEEVIDGRRTLRYDYQVSLFMSRYSVSDGANQATVPYAGSIWADAETANLVRVEVRTEDVPFPLSISATVTEVDYTSVPLGGSEFLLPASARLVTNFRAGGNNTNTTEFRNCRAFGAESLLSFDDGDSAAGMDLSLTLEEFELPARVSMTVRLDAEINSEDSVAGDRIEATLASDVRRDGELLAPKGSVLIGRIRRLERFTDPKNHFIVGLEFTELHTPNRRARIKTELVHVTHFGGLVEQFGEERKSYSKQGGGLAGEGLERTTVESYSMTALPGASEIYVRATRLRVPAGLRMVWRTLPADP
jgi:hypothetical protein